MNNESRQDLLNVMSTVYGSKLESLKDIGQASRLAVTLWKLDADQFPFLDEKSPFFMGTGHKQQISFQEFKQENRNLWKKILACLAAVPLADWTDCLQEMEGDFLERFLESDEVATEYFCIIFLLFLREAYPLIFRKLESRYPQTLENYLSKSRYFKSGSKADTFFTPRSRRLSGEPLTGNSPNMMQSEPKRGREHFVTDQSIQDLLKTITQRETDLQIVREDLLAREKEVADLQDRLLGSRAEVRNLREEVESKEAAVYRLSFKIETLESAVEQQLDSKTNLSLGLANTKIEDLYVEIDQLHRKNADLQHKYEMSILSKRLPREVDGSLGGHFDEDERQKAETRRVHLQNQILEDKVKVLEGNNCTLSEKLLRERDTNSRFAEQFQEIHRVLTQKEINIKSLQSEKESLAKENEHLKDTVVTREFEIKKLELDFTNILSSGQAKYETTKKNLPSLATGCPSTDANLELIKVCKEVNKSYLRELTCVYSLLHDSFVSELTGTSLHEMVRKRLEEDNRSRLQGPI